MDCTNYSPYTLPEIDFVGGETQSLSYNIYSSENGNPFDLSGCCANFSIVSYINRTGTPCVSKPMEIVSGGDSVNNVLKVTLTPSDTIDLFGKYIYQITIKDAGGVVEIPRQGIMRIINNIDKTYIR